LSNSSKGIEILMIVVYANKWYDYDERLLWDSIYSYKNNRHLLYV